MSNLRRLIAYKRLHRAPPKLPLLASFIRKTLYGTLNPAFKKGKFLII
jgi:hypothetical protein